MSRARVVVVGAGPAGMMAAAQAARLGCAVVLVDEAPRPGGQIHRQPPPSLAGGAVSAAARPEAERKRRLFDRFARHAGAIDHRPGTSVTAVYGLDRILIADETSSQLIHADALVVATGLHERVVPVPGWTLPGVVTAGALQALLKGGRVRAGDRIAVAGAGPLPLVAAAQMVEAGATVPVVALLRPPWSPLWPALLRDPAALWAGRGVLWEGWRWLSVLRRAGVPVLTRHVALSVSGDGAAERLVIARHDGRGRPVPGTEQRFAADTVAFNHGFTANGDLARMAGAETRFDPRRGGWLPVRDGDGATSVPGLFVAGDAGGLAGGLAAACDGAVVGAAAAGWALHRDAGRFAGQAAADRAERARHWTFQAALAASWELPPDIHELVTPATVVCRCEGVTRARIDRAVADGHDGLNGLKRNTRAGMGSCGGRSCLRTLAALAGPRGEAEAVNARPGIRPVTLAALANRVSDETVAS